MPEAKRTEAAAEPHASAKAAEPGPTVSKPRPSESTDPAVHQLLARWEAHRTTLASHEQAATLADADRKSAAAEIEAIRKELRGMGFEVG